MTKKKIGQKGFVDIILEGKSKEGVLDEIAKLLDFGPLANAIDARLERTVIRDQ